MALRNLPFHLLRFLPVLLYDGSMKKVSSTPYCATLMGIFFAGLTCLPPAAAEETAAAPVPVAPIAPIDFHGWTNALRLANEVMEVVVVPEIGRIAHVSWRDGPNLLRLDEQWYGQAADDIEQDDWINFGGDWIWPVPQPHWPLFQESTWPPSRLLDGRNWSGRAWETEEGQQYAMITQNYGEPLNIRVSRTVVLDAHNGRFQVRQRVTAVAPTDIPISLWQISQIPAAEWSILPVDEDTAFEKGYIVLMNEAPDEHTLTRHDDIWVYQAGLESHKIGVDSARRWIAAIKGDTLFTLRAEPRDGEGPYPEGGCTIELFTNTGPNRYIELETLSVEQPLDTDEHISNVLHFKLHRLTAVPTTPEEVARVTRKAMGEATENEAESVPE